MSDESPLPPADQRPPVPGGADAGAEEHPRPDEAPDTQAPDDAQARQDQARQDQARQDQADPDGEPDQVGPDGDEVAGRTDENAAPAEATDTDEHEQPGPDDEAPDDDMSSDENTSRDEAVAEPDASPMETAESTTPEPDVAEPADEPVPDDRPEAVHGADAGPQTDDITPPSEARSEARSEPLPDDDEPLPDDPAEDPAEAVSDEQVDEQVEPEPASGYPTSGAVEDRADPVAGPGSSSSGRAEEGPDRRAFDEDSLEEEDDEQVLSAPRLDEDAFAEGSDLRDDTDLRDDVPGGSLGGDPLRQWAPVRPEAGAQELADLTDLTDRPVPPVVAVPPAVVHPTEATTSSEADSRRSTEVLADARPGIGRTARRSASRLPAQTADGPTPDPDVAALTPRRRLLVAMRPRASRAQLLGMLLCFVLGLAGFLAVRQNQNLGLDSMRQSDLVGLLDNVTEKSARLEGETRRLQDVADQLRSGSDRSAAAMEAARQRLETLGILAGTSPAVGPGIKLTITDPKHAVTAAILLDTVQELRDAGAEAIQISDVRVVASTAFVDGEGGVRVDGTQLAPPYVFLVIGDSQTLGSALNIPGGVLEVLKQQGAAGKVESRTSVTVSALRAVSAPQYARPATSATP